VAALIALEIEVVVFALYGTAHWYVPLLVVLATAFAFIAGTVRIARRGTFRHAVHRPNKWLEQIIPVVRGFVPRSMGPT
jgi:hypothetical protein